jgi:hypothetical protein
MKPRLPCDKLGEGNGWIERTLTGWGSRSTALP